jgi:hypothetical protein
MSNETHAKDLVGRPILQGGCTGKQEAFLDIEDFKTLKEREKVNAKNDKQGQLRLF